MRGRNFRKGLQKSRIWPKNREVPKKRSSKNFWGMRLKSRASANLKSAQGGRHPSYATARVTKSKSSIYYCRLPYKCLSTLASCKCNKQLKMLKIFPFIYNNDLLVLLISANVTILSMFSILHHHKYLRFHKDTL